jgi:hypothetical protein
MLELYFHETEGVCFKHRSDFFKIGWEGMGGERGKMDIISPLYLFLR